MRRINLITWNNERGLGRNVYLLADLLERAGYRVLVNGLASPYLRHHLYPHHLPYRVITGSLVRRSRCDINLFLEYVVPEWLDAARTNCLIPNQEWFRDDYHSYLPHFDLVLCKTRFAQSTFDRLGCKTIFTSFTSLDRLTTTAEKDYGGFLHVAGNSLQKGTATLVEVWRHHPRWPTLTVVQATRHARPIPAANVRYVTGRVSDTILRQYQNRHGVHVAPSEAEGFGHSIVEAMSCRSVVVTTDAPPMNEVISSERGLLAGYNAARPQRLGVNFYVDPDSLAGAVDSVLAMSPAAKTRRGRCAREWYVQNDRFFRQTLREVLAHL